MKAAPIAIALVLLAPATRAAEPKGKDPKAKVKLDLGLGSFGALPTGSEVIKRKVDASEIEPTLTASEVSYEVVRVQHGRSFLRTASGAMPVGGPLQAIPLVGTPPLTEKFTTVIRVKSPRRVAATIDVEILDPRGNTAMSASGEVSFRGVGQDEVDYTVDWDKSEVRGGGQYQLVVRLSNRPMGSWPLRIGVEPPADAGPAD